jgi:hypothetical protein
MARMGETCSICGRTADADVDGDPPLRWCADTVEIRGGHRTRWVCAECTRSHVRSIEAKLDREWW